MTMEDNLISKRQINRLRRKEAKFKAQALKQELIKFSDIPTNVRNTATMLCVSNAGLGNGLSREHVYVWLSSHSTIVDIIMVQSKPYCFVKTAASADSERLIELSGSQIKHEGIPQLVEHFLFYVTEIPEVYVCGTVLPSGLFLLEDYISSQLDEELLHLIDWSAENGHGHPTTEEADGRQQTAGSMKNRSVKHYGYEFKYSTNNVDPDQPLPNQIPDVCKEICDRLIADGHMAEQPDQLTVNKYEPGQGIPPHVDTHSAFTGAIVSLSLGSQVIMTFSNPTGDCRQVLLPRRSVLIMTGESRYLWSHGIVPRKTDVISSADGLTLSYRQTRVSFTFRRLRRAACHCDYPVECDSQSFGKPKQSSIQTLTDEQARRLEETHVHQVYDTIATHFSGTRHTQWPKVAEFISSLPVGSLLADIGCGNGKYLPPNPTHPLYKIGFERSRDLADICWNRGYPIIQADCLSTPLLDNMMDACLCIAVIHHLSTQERRRAAIKELLRILQPGGQCLIYVWAMEQKKGAVSSTYLKPPGETTGSSLEYLTAANGDCQLPVHRNRTEFASSDMLVPWNLKSARPPITDGVISRPPTSNSTSSENCDTLTSHNVNDISHSQHPTEAVNNVSSNLTLFHRYYHIFREGELENLCSSIDNCRILRSYYDQGNWCVVITKEILS